MLPAAAAAMLLGLVPMASAADCPRNGALGTSRVLAVDPATTPRVGLKSFPQTLPLADKEIVLTFDDGPHPPTTRRVLAALAAECVRATFFLVGRNSAASPQLVREIAAAGHTVAHHSWSHPSMVKITDGAAREDIERGMAADTGALRGSGLESAAAPFFRFPGFESSPALLAWLDQRRIGVFGADFWASDWNPMTPAEQLRLISERTLHAGRGIVLFHDTKQQTAAMLADYLKFLRDNGFRIVHIVGPAPRPRS